MTVSKDQTVKVQVLSTNDFHGRLNPQTGNGAPAGGAAWLAAYLGRAEAENAKGTLLVDGGGSTTMTLGTELVNRPSDATGERPIGDAVVLLR
jgi:2',3'-cyclic-nucleotide 2'-phosphodiesterase (5'-nucleotidase family)